MPKYAVYLKTGAYARVVVEASDPDEAVDEAMDNAPDICAQCSGWNEDYSLELPGEWDLDEDATDGETPGVEVVEP